jgi:DNA-binding PadR family transcriptional regulator
MSIKKFENSGVLQILLFLYENGKTKVTDIKIQASSGTVYRALNTLGKLGLITEERKPPFTRYIELTEDGQAVGKRLAEIKTVLEAKRNRPTEN